MTGLEIHVIATSCVNTNHILCAFAVLGYGFDSLMISLINHMFNLTCYSLKFSPTYVCSVK